MDYEKYDLSSYNLHIIKTKKFKTIIVLVNFKKPITKDEVTIRNLLPLVLLQSNKKYPTKRLLNIAAEKLYGIEVNINEQTLGNYGIVSFALTMINEKYTEKGMQEKSLSFLFDILFNPHIENEAFNSKSFNIVKNNFKSKLYSIKDDTKQYSIIRMLEELDNESPLSFRVGYLDDLEKITPEDLYEYYQKMLKSDKIDIYVLGDIESYEIKKIFLKHFKINTIKKRKENLIIVHKKYRKRIKKIKEYERINQAKLSIGCKLIRLSDYEKKYVFPIFCKILGGPGASKLFINIREKNSLSYYITSIYRMADNLLLIISGINNENFEKTLQLIKKELHDMVKGNISDEELENAKKDMISVIQDIEDIPVRVINSYALMNLVGLDDFEERKKKYFKVTKEELKQVAKKVKMDTVFLLYGDEKSGEEEN